MPKYDRVVVGLTTIPSRALKLRPVLESVASQTRMPDRFYISISEYSAREKKGYPQRELVEMLRDELPKGVGYLNLMSIDYGPLTKLMGMLLCEDKKKKNTLLITIDDDHALDERFVECMVEKATMYYGDVVSFFAENISFHPFEWGSKGVKTSIFGLNEGQEVNIVCGYGGVAYPLMHFQDIPDAKMEEYRTTIDDLARHDDMLISCWLKKLGVKKRVVDFYGVGDIPVKPLPQSYENALCAFDGNRNIFSGAGHAVQWAKLARTLIEDLGILESGHEIPISRNIVSLVGTTLAALLLLLPLLAKKSD
jgi:hypothetical protein